MWIIAEGARLLALDILHRDFEYQEKLTSNPLVAFITIY